MKFKSKITILRTMKTIIYYQHGRKMNLFENIYLSLTTAVKREIKDKRKRCSLSIVLAVDSENKTCQS